MAVKFKNSQDYLNKIQLVINVLIALPLAIFIYLFLKIESQNHAPDLFSQEILLILRISIFLLTVVIVLLGIIAFKRQVNSLNPEMHLRDKLELYYSSALTRSLLIEVSSFIVLIGYYLSAEEIYVAYYAISLIGFSITYPTLHRITRQLKLKKEEREIIISREKIN